jgi:hypothetical protein
VAVEEEGVITYEIRQDGMIVASASSENDESAWLEAQHYAMMCSADGPGEIVERVGRRYRVVAKFIKGSVGAYQ